MIITKKYLVFYTDENAPEKHITAESADGRKLFEAQVRLCKSGLPYCLDVERFIGEDIYFYSDGGEVLPDCTADSPAAHTGNAQRFRPQLHYTTPYGWLNDPNGLIYENGRYHVFCQHNPLGTAWGNMHWYHSITTDFAHFEHLGDALFPESEGTMFSGSAVCDTENVSGLGKNALLLYYTSAGYSDGAKFTQCLAYSADGIHFTKYENNPIVPNIKGENRDPKVVFVPEMNAYIMALYLDGCEYCLLKSVNLIDWEQIQTIRLDGDGECPDLYCLPDCRKWVLSGASDCYIIGRFDKNGFIAEQLPLRFYQELDGRCSYAAQSYSGVSGRVLRLTWENINPENGQCFCGQLSVPFEMSSVAAQDGTVRLKASLCSELESRLTPVQEGCAGRYAISEAAYVADIETDGDCTLDIDGAKLYVSADKNAVIFGDNSITLTEKDTHNIRLIVDRMSVEILADGGLIYSCIKNLCGSHTRSLDVSGSAAKVRILKYQ